MSDQQIVLTRRTSKVIGENYIKLPLSAEERTKLRGSRVTECGKKVLLQLPREGSLQPGEVLIGENPVFKIIVVASIENLIQVESSSYLQLIKAAYHLGNRHVNLELHDNLIYLLKDPVLEQMLIERGLNLKQIKKPFFPEHGAYSHFHNNPH